MRFVQYQDCISPHQVPLAKELVKRLGVENFRYVYRDKSQAERVRMGWSMDETAPWFVHIGSHPDEARDLIENADFLLCGMRDVDLWLRRTEKGLTTFVQSERWFKPLPLVDLRLFDCAICVQVPGWIRMLHPRYRRMAKRFVDWIKSDPNARCLTIGPWSRKDMLRLGAPDAKIVPWGYFVEPSTQQSNNRTIRQSNNLKVLWVGRMLNWKRVDTIVRAVKMLGENVELTLVGSGPCCRRLQHLASGGRVRFMGQVSIGEIRGLMCQHDVYVLASNEQEGWGAALSEALEEGMRVAGTYEAGSSATILPVTNLFHAGDYKALARILSAPIPAVDATRWTASAAAERLMKML